MRLGLSTILIIEDHLPTLELYQRELSRAYRVLVCCNRSEALQVLQTQSVSAVVLEPAAWGGEGWAILAAIMQASTERSVPVIVCSTQDERKRGLEMGASLCLVKPVLPTTLLELLHRITNPLNQKGRLYDEQ